MRFLTLQDKQCPLWAYDQTREAAEQHGHRFVAWEAHLQLGKDFDGVLMFPRPAYCLDYVCQQTLEDHDYDDDDISVEIGKGLYAESIAKRPNSYVVCYDTDSNSRKTIHLLQGWETERLEHSNNYNEWGKFWFKKIKSSPIERCFKILARPGIAEPVSTSIITEARRLLLLLTK